MTQDKFFTSPKSWSKRKHRLLGKYLPPFSAKIGRWADVVYCIDGFAGAAKYDDGSVGSPLMMAQLADKCASWKRPVNLRLINVEANPDNFKSLEHVTKPWVDRKVVHNMLGEFSSLVSDILSELGNRPAFLFIDPYGPTYVHFSDLIPILKRQQRATEMIINFDADGLRRIADTIYGKAQVKSSLKAIQTNITNVTHIIGSDKWKEYFTTNYDERAAHEREEILLNEYTSNIAKYGYTVLPYPIRKSIYHYPKYYLVYCTRHQDGILLMNSFIREEEDDLLRDSTSEPDQPILPSDEFDRVQREVQDRRVELAKLIWDYLSEVKTTTRGKIRHHFIMNHFGEFHDKDYNHVVQELVNQGKVQTGHGKKRFNDMEPLRFTP